MGRIRVSADKAIGSFPDNWRQCVGTGHMGLALQEEYQNALALVQNEIGFNYIRGHGLLSDSVGIYRKNHWSQKDEYVGPGPGLNFTYVDRIFDSLLGKGIRPFVELGFMPGDLASGTQTQFYWKANVTPPKDYGEWRRLITGLVSHFVDRYGREEVLLWPFEVWNEPDIPGFWAGDQQEYFKLYRETARAVKEVDPDIQVGGPATCPAGINWITPFLEMCEKEKVPVDLVTTHSYYADKWESAGEYMYQTMHPIRHSIDQFADARRRIKESPFPDLPLHITEYNSSWSPRCPLHDTAYNAAFLGRLLSAGGDTADSFSYWTFSDVFEENDVGRAQFHGGFGLVAFNNIRKPTFHLFSFFAHLGDKLLYRDDNMLATLRDDGTIVLVAWNPVEKPGGDATFDIALDIGFPSAQALITRHTVDEDHGNAWNAWREMGRPRYPSDYQLGILEHASVPRLEVFRAPVENGTLKLDMTLSRNAVILVEVAPLKDETPTYGGLDESRIPGY
ncbi:MAG: xylan 1,4-beta-xylosidase [Chitinivibrionales bacterium]|nr:xylan 1,4-beta-xylosidase [Chitinivibrionales bacterium]MBD3395101.1 xylan 1,4-beta-xylosidase [Chitinivibrionales bacterium]